MMFYRQASIHIPINQSHSPDDISETIINNFAKSRKNISVSKCLYGGSDLFNRPVCDFALISGPSQQQLAWTCKLIAERQ